MPDKNKALKALPKVDEVLAVPLLAGQTQAHGHPQLLEAVRTVLQNARQALLQGSLQQAPDAPTVAGQALELLQQAAQPSLRRVINATGIVLHTNLGRAPLAQAAVDAVVQVAQGYSNLEYDLAAGVRGSRHAHVEALLCRLCGAQAAMVVNNNAAAVLLCLGALAAGKQVVVSRGELVEIGGSFRIPDIMALSGAVLREVGTTNRTHAADYERAIGEETGALFKAHTSNYKIQGFTTALSLEQLVAIGQAHNLPVLYDLGGGYLAEGLQGLLPDDPGVADCVQAGAGVVCFSGDKLLGGPQAGIVVGKQEYIDAMKKHPLARAVRVDKMTLAGLEATLRLYLNPEKALAENPTLAMLRAPQNALKEKAEALAQKLGFLGDALQMVPSEGEAGAGSAPVHKLPSFAVALQVEAPHRLEAWLRGWRVPIVARVHQGQLLLDVRTLLPQDFDEIAACLSAANAEGLCAAGSAVEETP